MSETPKIAPDVQEDRRGGNRRAFPRWNTQFEVRYGQGKVLQSGQPLEIGEGGLSMIAEKLFPLEAEVDVEYRLGNAKSAPDEGWVRVKSIVRHSQNKKLGVEFLNLRRIDRLKLVDFIQSIE